MVYMSHIVNSIAQVLIPTSTELRQYIQKTVWLMVHSLVIIQIIIYQALN
jgi:phage-related minor tail protein